MNDCVCRQTAAADSDQDPEHQRSSSVPETVHNRQTCIIIIIIIIIIISASLQVAVQLRNGAPNAL